MAERDQKNIPLTDIRPSQVAFRGVNKDDENYQGIVESMRQQGVLMPILVREKRDKESGKVVYGLIDGLQRFTAAGDAGLKEIPAHIVKADEAGELEMQIVANFHRVKALPAQYAKQLVRLLDLNPTLTVVELSKRIGMSTAWLLDMFKLTNLTEPIQKLVDEGTINVTNAQALAKLPPEEQANYVENAITMSPAQFSSIASARAKQLKEARNQGRSADGPKEFVPPQFLQKVNDIKAEIESKSVGQGLISQFGLNSPLDAWVMALKWTVHLDPNSVEVSRQKDEERKQKAANDKEAKKAEKQAKEGKEAELIAASVRPDVEDEA